MFGRAAAILGAVMLLALYPLISVPGHMNAVSGDYLRSELTAFTRKTAGQGFISAEDMKLLRCAVPQGHEPVELELTVSRQVDVVKRADAAFYDRGVYVSDIHHVHSSACFVGHNHSAEGCAVHSVHTAECYEGEACGGRIVGGEYYNRRCSQCHTVLAVAYYETDNALFPGSSSFKKWVGIYNCGHSKGYYTTYQYHCNVCKKRYEFGGLYAGFQETCPSGDRKLICTKEPGSYNCGIGQNDENALCSKVVISELSGRNQVIFCGEGATVDSSVPVTFLDGSTGVLNGQISEFDDSSPGRHEVTLSFAGLFGNAENYTTETCVIEVLVLNRTKICEYGHEYELHADGSDGGCPWCSARLLGIRVENFRESIDFGDEPDFEVYAIYENGEKRLASGFETDFDPESVGWQEVTVYYMGKSDVLRVYVSSERNTFCGRCGRKLSAELYACEFCRHTVCGIEALLPGGKYVRLGEPLNICVTARFMDDHTERITDGFVLFGFDSDREGMQWCGIEYEGCTAAFEIVVTASEAGFVLCPAGHRYRLLYEGEPCPVCAGDAETKVCDESHRRMIYLEEIQREIDAKGYFALNKGDALQVLVKISGKESTCFVSGSLISVGSMNTGG